MTATFEVATAMVAIDTMMADRPKVTSAYLLRADEPVLIETGPTTSIRSVLDGLDQLGVAPNDLAHIIVTHIHLDHAGGVGRLAEQFPRATVWVHDRGARHLADPTRLVASAARVYGEERMQALFGPVDPVPAERLRSLSDGDEVKLGNRTIDVMYTPGHASHHISLIDSETGAIFTGDALGIHLPDVRVLRPATPPPDVDVELAVNSIERIRERARSMLMFSHFGPVEDVDELCGIAIRRWRRWAGIVRDAMNETEDVDRIGEILGRQTADEFRQAPPNAEVEGYEVLGTMRINAMGLVRYWKKREESHETGEGQAEEAGGREAKEPQTNDR